LDLLGDGEPNDPIRNDGRTPADCWRFWHSGELSATLEASRRERGARTAR
jgi:hypothetical protein